jgi:hypothetical protein
MIKVRGKLLACLVIAAFAITALWPAFHSPAMPMDEGVLLVYPEMLLKGHVPYRDFESVYGPGNFGILAAAYTIFGTDIVVERAVGLIYRLLILIAVFGVAQRWDTIVAGGCMFVTGLLLAATDAWANTWTAGAAFALCSLWTIAKPDSGWRCFTGGILAGMSLLCRCDFAPALIASSLPFFLIMKRNAKVEFIAGAMLAMLPLLWLMLAVGPMQIFDNVFLVPVVRSSSVGHLPIFSAKIEMLSLLGLQLVASIVSIAAAIAELRDPITRRRGRLLLSAALLGLAFTYYATSRFDSGHALNAAFVSIGLFPLSIFVLFSRTAKMFPTWLNSVLAVVIVIAAAHFLLPTFTRYFYRGLGVEFGVASARQADQTGELEPGDNGIFIKHNGRAFPFGFAYTAHDAADMLTELERVTLPGQRLFVGPGNLSRASYCDTYIYHMEPQLRPATYFLAMNPGTSNAPHSRLSRDVESADWLVLNRRYDFLNESNSSTQVSAAEPNQVVRRNFDFWWECGSYLLYRNKKLSNAIVLPPPPRS